MAPRRMRLSLHTFILLLLVASNVVALKGQSSSSLGRSRALQSESTAPPAIDAKAPKEDGAAAAKEPKDGSEKAVKEDNTVGAAPKEAKDKKKLKKCDKLSKGVPPPELPPAERPEDGDNGDIVTEQASAEDEENDETVCLEFDASADNCRAAQNGQGPKGSEKRDGGLSFGNNDENDNDIEQHKSVKGNVEMDISYAADTTAELVLLEVEEVFRSSTAADFLGCDAASTTPATGSSSTTWQDGSRSRRHRNTQEWTNVGAISNQTTVTVTGVDFQDVKLAKKKDCESTTADMNCDTIESKVEIFYQGDDLDRDDEQAMLNLLVSTIEAQATSGDFASAGQIESVEALSAVSSTGSSSDGSSAATATATAAMGLTTTMAAAGATLVAALLA